MAELLTQPPFPPEQRPGHARQGPGDADLRLPGEVPVIRRAAWWAVPLAAALTLALVPVSPASGATLYPQFGAKGIHPHRLDLIKLLRAKPSTKPLRSIYRQLDAATSRGSSGVSGTPV